VLVAIFVLSVRGKLLDITGTFPAMLYTISASIFLYKRKTWYSVSEKTRTCVRKVLEYFCRRKKKRSLWCMTWTGHFLLTNLLLDKLLASAPSRIVNTIGAGYQKANIDFHDFNSEQLDDLHYGEAYSRSKLAMALFTLELSRRLEGSWLFTLRLWSSKVATGREKSLWIGRWKFFFRI